MSWISRIAPGFGPDGAPILSVLAKRTYRIEQGKPTQLDEEPIPFQETDTFYGAGDPSKDAPKLESEVVAYKPATDFIVIAKAQSPRGRPAHWLDVGVQVENSRRIARVFGNRHVRMAGAQIFFTDPQPFESMNLHMGLAYGGSDINSDVTPYTYPLNPIGKGFIVKPNPDVLQDLVLPNIEDPEKMLTPGNLVLGDYRKWIYYPVPMGFGCIAKTSHPRYTFASAPPPTQTETEALRQFRALNPPHLGKGKQIGPLLQPEYFNSAPLGLRFPHLRGDENITLANLDANFPQFNFRLPGDRPRAWIDIGLGRETLAMQLDTVTLFKETNQITLIWRGSAYYGGPEAFKEFTAFEFGLAA